MSRTKAVIACLALLSTGAAARLQAQAAPAIDFYTIEPCRAVDTRETAQPLLPGVVRRFTVHECGVPLSAFAVVFNVTAVDAVGTVEIAAFPGDLSPVGVTIVAASPSRPTAAAEAVLRLATDGTGTLGVLGRFDSPSGRVHLLLDVTGYFDLEDPGSTEDPGGVDLGSTLGQPPEAFAGDPQLLDVPELYPPELVGSDPSFGYAPAAAPMVCAQYAGATVTPIGIRAASPRYLAYAGKFQLLVGASADAACHFLPPLPPARDTMKDKCNADPSHANYYPPLLDALEDKGLNKIRLWVALGEEKDPRNVPFLQDTQGYWRLDQRNPSYFERLRAVVSKAKELDMFVEVTFFAPFEGGAFNKGPWSYEANRSRAPDPDPGGQLTRAGFTSSYYFVIKDTGVNAAKNERMRKYQQKVIEWTIEELWCYDNVLWEIANEPEDVYVLPLSVADWQRSMIATVLAEDSPAKHPALTRRHLIAVQPFTQIGGDAFIGDANVDILNGHYTQVLTDSVKTFPNPSAENRLNLGAIQLARRYASRSKVLGFNEGKITPLGGTTGTRRHRNGVVGTGPEAARAEAWEFLFDRGALLDHWGYLSNDGASSPTVQAMRDQLSALKTFVGGVPLGRLRSSANPPGWITGGTLNKYPTATLFWESATSSQRYWAALQADENAATDRWFLLYIHHSTRRCRPPKKGAEPDFTSSGCSDPPRQYLSNGGYDARVWTASSGKSYRDSFTVDLGPNPGTFDVFWIDPANLQTVKQQAIAWRQSTCSLPGCVVCPQGTPCSIGLSSSEGYNFDIVLKIVQRP
jgi:hypothetical protein